MIFKKRTSYDKSGPGAGKKGQGGMLKNSERYLKSFAFLLIALIALFMMNLPGKAQDDSVKRLEERLAILEKIVLEGDPAREERDRKMIEGLEAVTIRCERLEGALPIRGESISRRMDSLNSEMDGLKVLYESGGRKKNEATVKEKIVRKKSRVTKNTPEKKPVYHAIKNGETFYSISKKYGISLDQLQRLNGLTSKSIIYPGQKLLIKK